MLVTGEVVFIGNQVYVGSLKRFEEGLMSLATVGAKGKFSACHFAQEVVYFLFEHSLLQKWTAVLIYVQ